MSGGIGMGEFGARVAMVGLFFTWGVVLLIPRDFEPPDPDESWWGRPRVFAGILAVGVSCVAFSSGGAHGDIATLVVLLAVVPMALGAGLALWLRRKPPPEAASDDG